MALTTIMTYTGDGATNTWSISYSYLKKSHVTLTIDGVADTTFTWLTDSSIAATSIPADGAAVVISRNTPRDALDTVIPASGTFRGADINNQSLQALYVAEEGYDALVNILSLDTADNTWDAQSKIIKNVATPTADHHAARKDYVDAVAGSATAAAASASSAAASATAASGSATSASGSASAASSSASAASTSASNALASENAAELAETNAAASEAAAAISETNAGTSETNAAASASAASTSETNAAASESAASTSETNAAASEAAAAASYDSFDDRYLGAKASDPTLDNDGDALVAGALYWNTGVNSLKVYNGSTWEDPVTDAETAETNAQTAETNAAASAAAASTSETNAASSASAASTSASNAATSETNAATSETNAATSETNAATSETNAAASYDQFDDRYLGSKASDPTLDNDGAALLTGAIYWNTTVGHLKVYTGTVWNDFVADAETAETNALASETAAAASETAAGISETNASNSASAATTQAGIATTQASTATTQAGIATTQASAASTSASNAATSESNAATSESNAATSESNAAATYDLFDDRMLGAKASDPTLDNDGNALVTGTIYWNTTSSKLRIWNGSAFEDAAIPASGAVVASGTPLDNQVGVWTNATTIEGTTGLTYNGTAFGVTGNITVSGTVDGRDLATDGSKLDGIEALADVTDTANVTAAGALMDSEVTNLAQVKAFNSADYATAGHNHTLDSLSNTTITTIASGELLKWNGTAWINNTLAEAGIQPAGSYAAASHTHVMADITDLTHDGLSGFVANEHIDWTNATSALVTTQDITGQELFSSSLGTNAAPSADDLRVHGYGIMGNRTTLYITNANATGAVQIGTGGIHNAGPRATFNSTGMSVTGNISVTGTVDGRDVATDGTKLDGIESGATADQTAGEIESIVNHDNLVGFVANEHIDWTNASSNILTSGIIETTNNSGFVIDVASGDAKIQFQQGSGQFNVLYKNTGETGGLHQVGFSDSADAFIYYFQYGAANTHSYYFPGTGDFNVTGNANFSAGVDVTGNITVTGTVDTVDIAAFKSSYDSHTHTFASLTSKPTTLAGYGITDAVAQNDAALALGTNDTTQGILTLYGSSATAGGRIDFYLGATADTTTDDFTLAADGSGNFAFQEDSVTKMHWDVADQQLEVQGQVYATYGHTNTGTISENKTVKNQGVMAGPIVVSDTYTLTVASGARLVIS